MGSLRLLVALLLLSACGAGAPRYVPSLWVRARGARGDRLVLRPDGALGVERGPSWRVEAGLRWRLGQVPPLLRPPPSPRPPDPTSGRCPSPRLCAWERRARRRAVSTALERNEL